MKITIKLKYPNLCDGCPLLKIGEAGKNSFCHFNCMAIYRERNTDTHTYSHIRPEECIKENGK